MVTKRTSNVSCQCELGRKQLYISGFKVAIAYWFCILNDSVNVILKMIYAENITSRFIWRQNLKEIIVKHGLGDIWTICHNNTVKEHPPHRQPINCVHQRITDVSVQNTMTNLYHMRRNRG